MFGQNVSCSHCLQIILLSAHCILSRCSPLLSLGNALLLALDMPILSKPLKHDMPESDEEAQRVAEESIGIWPCLWQIKVVCMILEQWDVITIAATGSGKSLIYWMALLFIKHGIVVLVTPLKLLKKQFVSVLDKNELTAVFIESVK